MFDFQVFLLIFQILREKKVVGKFASDLEYVLETERICWERNLMVKEQENTKIVNPILVAWKKRSDLNRNYIRCSGIPYVSIVNPPKQCENIMKEYKNWIEETQRFTSLNRACILGITSVFADVFKLKLPWIPILPKFSISTTEKKLQWTYRQVRKEMKVRKRYLTRIRDKVKKLQNKNPPFSFSSSPHFFVEEKFQQTGRKRKRKD